MPVTLNPYLSFRDTAREALEFYRTVFGGEVTTMTFAEGQMVQDPDEADLLMHGQLVTGQGLTLMAADTPKSMERSPGDTMTVSLSGDDSTGELTRYWEGLSEGATITAPFVLAPWGDRFGMLVDRFGVPWMINSSMPAA